MPSKNESYAGDLSLDQASSNHKAEEDMNAFGCKEKDTDSCPFPHFSKLEDLEDRKVRESGSDFHASRSYAASWLVDKLSIRPCQLCNVGKGSSPNENAQAPNAFVPFTKNITMSNAPDARSMQACGNPP